jgi:elongator complex protein 5
MNGKELPASVILYDPDSADDIDDDDPDEDLDI